MRNTIYTCINCDKTFDRKSNYEVHLNRKVPCVLKPITMNILKEETSRKLEVQQQELSAQNQKIDELEKKIERLLLLVDQKHL